ncbi:ABC transporter substrate-binding protein [Bradyrhizobium manausense]|uniref:ABC transporter substrate-binding protein n=1 Tax=Bradyrhizobium manausense TaxID=989370 RepID=UPI001BAA9F8C|nr:ABC transporter substrate-binding protein [Bradyrhizobium manausense]MBR0687848.1 ABC transporter substrate-binding protein [Bradyrhizobium manausense]
MILISSPTVLRATLVAANALLAIALAGAPAWAQKAEPCIAGSWELTGPIAHMGLAVRMGVETAVDEINEAGGVLGQKLRVIAYDDQGEPSRAVDNARRIGEQDNCIAMIGGFRTPNALAIRPVVSEIGLPWMGVMSAGTRVIEWEQGTNEWMFRTSMKDRWVAPFLLKKALERSSNKKIGLMFEATGWGQGAVPDIEAAAKGLEVKLVGKETFNLKDQDLSAQLIRLRDGGADTVIYYGVDPEGQAMLRSMERIGYKPTIVSAWGLSAKLGEAAGTLADGVFVAGTFAWTGQLDARADGIWKRMKTKFSLDNPGQVSMPSGTANAYDAVYIIAEALKIAGSFDRARMRDAFYKVKYKGITGTFDPAFELAAERHDSILPSQYKLLAYYKGLLMPVEQTPFVTK